MAYFLEGSIVDAGRNIRLRIKLKYRISSRALLIESAFCAVAIFGDFCSHDMGESQSPMPNVPLLPAPDDAENSKQLHVGPDPSAIALHGLGPMVVNSDGVRIFLPSFWCNAWGLTTHKDTLKNHKLGKYDPCGT